MSLTIGYNGNLVWRNKEGQCHRENGPAAISLNGHIRYAFNGLNHRLDGPAVIYPEGYKCYQIHGRYYPKEEYYAKVKEL